MTVTFPKDKSSYSPAKWVPHKLWVCLYGSVRCTLLYSLVGSNREDLQWILVELCFPQVLCYYVNHLFMLHVFI